MPNKKWIVIAVLLLVLIGVHAEAADTSVAGYVVNMTSMPEGLLVMLDAGIPDRCEGTPYGWMIIPEENKTMVAVAMMAYMQNDRKITLGVNGTFFGGYCLVGQAHLLPRD